MEDREVILEGSSMRKDKTIEFYTKDALVAMLNHINPQGTHDHRLSWFPGLKFSYNNLQAIETYHYHGTFVRRMALTGKFQLI